ncbi:MAG: MBL fold metallo-hydrolase [Acidimicrobiales bacterium]
MEAAYQFDQARIYQVVVGDFENNVYVVQCARTGESLLVDAAAEAERLLEMCELLHVKRVVETHGHHDHIGAVDTLRDAGLPVGIGEGDAGRLSGFDEIIQDGQVLRVGELRIIAHATPGHTAGSICYSIEGVPVLFSGDTLFPGGPGATSYEGGDFPTIIESIRDRIFAKFSEDTLVLPGHGRSTTIGDEAPHLEEWIARGW